MLDIKEFFSTQDSVKLINDRSMEEIQKFLDACETFVRQYKEFRGGKIARINIQ